MEWWLSMANLATLYSRKLFTSNPLSPSIPKSLIFTLSSGSKVPFSSHMYTQGPLRHKQKTFFLSFLLTGATAAGLLAYFMYEKRVLDSRSKFPTLPVEMELISSSAGSVGQARIGGQPFTLIDHHGNLVDESIFTGKFSLLYFGFTHCPDICPEELDKIAEIIDQVDSQPRYKDLVTPIFISVDPKRDTPEVITEYLKDFHPKILGLTGSKEQLLKFAKQYRVYFSVSPLTDDSKEDYLVDHSVFFYLVGPDGKFVDFFGNDMSSEAISAKIGHYISTFG